MRTFDTYKSEPKKIRLHNGTRKVEQFDGVDCYVFKIPIPVKLAQRVEAAALRLDESMGALYRTGVDEMLDTINAEREATRAANPSHAQVERAVKALGCRSWIPRTVVADVEAVLAEGEPLMAYERMRVGVHEAVADVAKWPRMAELQGEFWKAQGVAGRTLGVTTIGSALFARYRDSEQWKPTVRYIRERSGGVCEVGPCTGGAVHIHHEDYARAGCELLADLLHICRPCHDRKESTRSAKRSNGATHATPPPA